VPGVIPVTPADVRPLRSAILRPGQPPEALVYPGDDDPAALHAAILDPGDGRVVGIASVAPDPHPHGGLPGDWRLRGMATDPAVRGRGYGAALLAACVEHARAHGGRRIWCNARVPARSLYERGGFTIDGGDESFDIPGIGPHLVMSLEL
jgi:GNAT superfamily N-acetyltransferase